jgi:demethylmenaquinone methyltransferase/2-methoxy-6-polyprenyl-1,4-benzoquinol methylase
MKNAIKNMLKAVAVEKKGMNTTKKFFNDYAPRWDKVNHYDQPPQAFRELVSMAGVPAGGRVVDLGCGTGVLVGYLHEAVGDHGHIYAVDVAEEMLVALTRKHHLPNLTVLATPAWQLEAISAPIDAVICFSAFPHFSDQPGVLRAVARLLKPKGRFLVAHFSSRAEINAFHAKLPPPICTHYLPNRRELADMAQDSGLRIAFYRNEKGRYTVLLEK